MAESVQQYGSISLGGKGGVSQGLLKLTPGSISWKRTAGGKAVEIKRDEIDGVTWIKISRDFQLGVRRKESTTLNFLGFKEKDFEALSQFCQSNYGYKLEELQKSTSGRNWGSLSLDGASLVFKVDDGGIGFDVPLPDVISAQAVKEDVVLELGVDDTTATDREDALVEVAFHVPPGNADWVGGTDDPPAKMLLDAILQFADVVGGPSSDASTPVTTFEDVAVLAPRGRFEVEMHLGHLKLGGQTQEFKIRYGSITRIFILPKSNTPHTAVVISLDPPIRKGQTYYSHLLCQFPTDDQDTRTLKITSEQLDSKNEKYGGKLTTTMTGSVSDVFAKTLRGLSGAKLSRTGSFRSASQDALSIRCSFKADEGHLYPLDRAFFYIHKPPMLLPYEDIESIEFQRQDAGLVGATVRTFDLVVKLKNGQEYQFRSLQRSEWENLFQFINSKKIRIEKFAAAKQGPGGTGAAVDIGDDLDPGLRNAAIEAGDDDEDDDEDFEGGSGSDDGSDDGSEDDDSDNEGSDAEMVAEEGIRVADVTGRGKKRAAPEKAPPPAAKKAKPAEKSAPAAPSGKAAPSKAAKGKEAAAKEPAGKKPKKKKDPAAPKKGLSAFMFFSNDTRDKVKADNPGIAFGEIGKVLGERWKALDASGKAKYEEKAAQDKKRYAAEMQQYTAKGGVQEDDDE